MTFVGRILVILIMLLSLVFLGVTTTAFLTATNWKEATAKAQGETKKALTERDTARAAQKDAENQSAQAKAEFAAAAKNLEGQVAGLTADRDTLTAERDRLRSELTDAQTNAKLATEESQSRTTEMTKLRDQLTASVNSGNGLKIEQTAKNVQILDLQRQLEATERSAKGLRENLARSLGQLRKAGLPVDLSQAPSVSEIPTDVEGKVRQVDARNAKMELTIGADDGVYVGMELFVFRTQPAAEYLGKVRVTAVDPDQAVAQVIGNTVHGKKIKEGDNVASTLRSK